MKIQNTTNTRIRIEGIGYVDPGNDVIVPDGIGRQLCAGGEFVEQKPKPRGRRAAATDEQSIPETTETQPSGGDES